MFWFGRSFVFSAEKKRTECARGPCESVSLPRVQTLVKKLINPSRLFLGAGVIFSHVDRGAVGGGLKAHTVLGEPTDGSKATHNDGAFIEKRMGEKQATDILSPNRGGLPCKDS